MVHDFTELNELLDRASDQAADNRRRWLLVEVAMAAAGRLEHKRPTFTLLSRVVGVTRGAVSRWHRLKHQPSPEHHQKLCVLARYERAAIALEKVTREHLKEVGDGPGSLD